MLLDDMSSVEPVELRYGKDHVSTSVNGALCAMTGKRICVDDESGCAM